MSGREGGQIHYAAERRAHGGHEAIALRCAGAGVLEAIFLPSRGMLCASLRLDGEELLGRTDELEGYVAKGSTVGIPLLHPWANRLAGLHYRAAGRDVDLDPASPLLHFDANGLPMHGVAGARLPWVVAAAEVEADCARVRARLEWSSGDRLAVFPFPHRLEMDVRLDTAGLSLKTALAPTSEAPVPVSFGFHPYLRLPRTPRSEWRVTWPPMRRLDLDGRGIPSGRESDFAWRGDRFGDVALDDAFTGLADGARFVVADDSLEIVVTFLEGYPCGQIYAPRGRDFVAIEPMTAPANALASGHGLRLAAPGTSFGAAFRIGIRREER